MRNLMRIPLILIAASCFAQAQDRNQELLQEMKELRATIDRLAKVVAAMQRTQDDTLVALQITRCENRIGVLESERRALAAQERDLDSRVMGLEGAAHGQGEAVDPSGLRVPVASQDPHFAAELRNRLDNARRSRDEVRAKLQAGDRERSELRSRIEQLQKRLEGAAR